MARELLKGQKDKLSSTVNPVDRVWAKERVEG